MKLRTKTILRAIRLERLMIKKRETKTSVAILLISILSCCVAVIPPGTALAALTVEVEILRGSTTLADRSFSPNPVEIAKGDTIRFVNNDSVVHTATSGDSSTATPSGIFDTGFLGPNKSAEITISEAGDIPYYCTAHPTMIGVVKVSEGPTSNNMIKLTAVHEGQSFEVTSSGTSAARASAVSINPGASVRVEFDGPGEAELTFPVDMIQGISSVATIGGSTIPFVKTVETDSVTTIKFAVPHGGEKVIVIMGARVVPEFSTVAAFIMVGLLATVIIASARLSRQDNNSSHVL